MEDKSIIDRIDKVKKSWKEKAEGKSKYSSIFGVNDSERVALLSCINDLSELLTDFYKEQ